MYFGTLWLQITTKYINQQRVKRLGDKIPSKYLTENTLHITESDAIEKIHKLFTESKKSEPPKSKYQKSEEEVMKFLKCSITLKD
jgi:hypothetical protein